MLMNSILNMIALLIGSLFALMTVIKTAGTWGVAIGGKGGDVKGMTGGVGISGKGGDVRTE